MSAHTDMTTTIRPCVNGDEQAPALSAMRLWLAEATPGGAPSAWAAPIIRMSSSA
ncbi:MAG: hypothetical protein ACOH2S_17595 [Janthinobacterium svalbardensis]|nr:hypothetical protein [Janthinobacterium svalbardensis]